MKSKTLLQKQRVEEYSQDTVDKKNFIYCETSYVFA